MDLAEKRKQNPVREGLERTGLYHSIPLNDGRVIEGAMPLAWQQSRLDSFGLPQDLSGKRVLDIGPWDGYFTFEMERRGAQVTGLDYVDLDTFRRLRTALNSQANYIRRAIYEMDHRELGQFDYVLCLGVLYHLKYPIEGLERVCAITTDTAIIDSFVIDGEEWLRGERDTALRAEFYERDELAGQLDNWWGPSVTTMGAWIRAAGFAEAELLRVSPKAATFAARRNWAHLPADELPALELLDVLHHQNRGRSFYSGKEEYIQAWLAWPHEEAPELTDIYPQVDGYGSAPIGCHLHGESLQVQFRVPPRLDPGQHDVRVKVGRHGWSNARPIWQDLDNIAAGELKVLTIQDNMSWESGVVSWDHGAWMTIWVDGLTPEADCGNVVVMISGVPHGPVHVDSATRQVNVQVRPVIEGDDCDVEVRHRGMRSTPVPVRMTGTRPHVNGLADL